MLITLVLYVCAIGMYLLGYFTLHTNKSIWSILAILAVLPASKSMVSLIMFLRFRSLDEKTYNEYGKAAHDAPVLYEAPFTTYEKTFFVDAVMCRNNIVTVCYLKQPSGRNSHVQDLKKLNDHLVNVLANDGFKDCTVKIFDSKKEFCDRLKKISEDMAVKDNGRDVAILDSLRTVIL